MFVAMSQSELLARRLEQQPQFISRAKVRDSSELTAINKARASGNQAPSRVYSSGIQTTTNGTLLGLSTTIVVQGKGTNMDHDAILERAQGCAICSDVGPSTTPSITLTPFVYSTSNQPYSQVNLFTATAPPCTIGHNVYFPAFLERGKSSDSAKYYHLPYPSG